MRLWNLLHLRAENKREAQMIVNRINDPNLNGCPLCFKICYGDEEYVEHVVKKHRRDEKEVREGLLEV